MAERRIAQPGQRLGMSIDMWPEQDRCMWQAALASKSVLRRGPVRKDYGSTSQLAMGISYARWLVWLTDTEPDALLLPPGQRATEERVVAFLHALVGKITFRTLASYASRLQQVLGLMAPGQSFAWIKPIVGNIERLARREPSVKHPFVPSGQLYAFGFELMDAAETDDALGDVARAELFRDGLAIAFLASRPLRRDNFIQLRLGEHLNESHATYRVVIPAAQVKTRTELDFTLPDGLTPFLTRYLAVHRVALLPGAEANARHGPDESNAVWIARSGRPLPSDTFADMIARRTLARFNLRLTPHGFRHAAATTIAQNNPHEALIIRLILGHTTGATSERFYIHASRIDAARRFQDVLHGTRRDRRP